MSKRHFPVSTLIERADMEGKVVDLSEEEVRRYWPIFGRDIYRDIDGYFVFTPSRVYGTFNEHSLCVLAGLLKIANHTWDESIKAYFAHEAERKRYG